MSNDLSGNSLWGPTSAPTDPSAVLLSYQNGGDGATAFTPVEVTIPAGYREVHVSFAGAGNGAAVAVAVLVGVGGGAIDATIAHYPGQLCQGTTSYFLNKPMTDTTAWGSATLTGVFVSNSSRASSAKVVFQGGSTPGITYWTTQGSDGASPGYQNSGAGQYNQSGVLTSVKVVTANSLVGEVVVWGIK